MIRIASLSKGEREELFLNTAQKIGMPPAIVEKDFGYVICWIIFSTAANGETGLFSKVDPACLKHIIRKEDDRVTG